MNRKAFDHKIWPIGLVVAMSVFLAFIMAVVTIAVRHKPQLVSEHYYAEGYNLKEFAAKQAATDATGWKVTLLPLPTAQTGMPLLEVDVLENNDLPCDSLTGALALYRPADQSLDIASVTFRFMGAGKYFVVLPRSLERGAWQAIVHLTRGQQEYTQRHNFFVDG